MSRFVDFKAVKAAVSMLQVLERYGLAESFKRSGNSLSGPCPLHGGENRTQFRVSLEKNCWNCFGTCKGGGNVLDFVARKEGQRSRRRCLGRLKSTPSTSSDCGLQRRSCEEKSSATGRKIKIHCCSVRANCSVS